MNTSPAALNVTRTEAVMRAWAESAEDLRRFEVEGEAKFARYHADREACAAEGLTVDIDLKPGLAAWYADWKQRKAARAGREQAREDADQERRRPTE